jgi:hypothetical protein
MAGGASSGLDVADDGPQRKYFASTLEDLNVVLADLTAGPLPVLVAARGVAGFGFSQLPPQYRQVDEVRGEVPTRYAGVALIAVAQRGP